MRYNVAKTGATAVGSQISLVNCKEGVKAGNWVELHKNTKGYMLVKEKKKELNLCSYKWCQGAWNIKKNGFKLDRLCDTMN